MTGLVVLRPGFLVLLVALPLLWATSRWWPPPGTPSRARASLALRLVLLALVVAALADVRVSRQPANRAVMAVVDLSDSTGAGQQEAAAAVAAIIDAKGDEDLVGVVTFGRDAQVELPPSRQPTFDGFQTRPDGSFSNLAGALELAANVVPDGYSRQIVLLSDGRQNLGDGVAAVEALRERAVRVDVVAIGEPPGPEVLVAALDVPAQLRVDQPLVATARLRTTQATRGRLVLQLDGREVEARDLDLPAGPSEQRFTLPPLEAGTHRLGVVVDALADGFSQNNQGEGVVRVVDLPTILLLESTPADGVNVARALEASGMRVERRRPEEAPTDASALSGFDGLVVAGAPADSFPPGALEAIATSVRDLGRGLMAIGGPAAFGPGGWAGTPLEDALPVRMEVPRPRERPSVAVAVLIETMEDPFGDLVALGAIDSVVDSLRPDDELAVVNMSAGSHTGPPRYVVPLGRPTDKEGIKRKVREETLGDPLGYGPALDLAVDALAPSTASVKHVVIIGDGDAVEDVGRYDDLFARAETRGVTVSSVGVATHDSLADMDHMRRVGRLGAGRFYQAEGPGNVPNFLLEESRSTLRPWYEQDPFFPTVTTTGDLLDGVPLDAFPQLGGYVATTPKPTAEVALASPKGDPVLAGGQYGLGRAVAWTSDARGRWTAGFLRSPVSALVFGQAMAWSLPNASSGDLRIDASPSGEGIEVGVAGPTGGGELEARLVSPTGVTASQALRPVAPGRWEATMPASEVGTYVLRTTLRRNGSVVAGGEASVPVPYGPEYLEVGRDDALLARFVRSGGTVLTRPAAAWAQPTPPITATAPIFWLLLLVVAVAWPVDIALRRLALSPRGLGRSARDAMARRRVRGGGPVDEPEREATGSDGGAPVARPTDPAGDESLAARLVEARRGPSTGSDGE